MKTDSLNLPGYPEVLQDATFMTSGMGQATRVFNALGDELRRRKWEADHPEEVSRCEENAFLRRFVMGQPLPTAEEWERQELYRKACVTLLTGVTFLKCQASALGQNSFSKWRRGSTRRMSASAGIMFVRGR